MNKKKEGREFYINIEVDAKTFRHKIPKRLWRKWFNVFDCDTTKFHVKYWNTAKGLRIYKLRELKHKDDMEYLFADHSKNLGDILRMGLIKTKRVK